ncbi:MAG: ROK family transcriptional regulator [Propionibacteriaceae bacterium]|nr:ROK family transcriptional regulator [Propionibacteriaceae bacterium]
MRSGAMAALRLANAEKVLKAVRASHGMVQAEISRQTGLSPASITNLVRELADRGMVEVEDFVFNGRKAKIVKPKSAPGYVLGVDVGRSHILMCLCDLGYQIIAERRVDMPQGMSSKNGLELSHQLYHQILDETGIDHAAVLHAGVGLPGPLDHVTGEIGAIAMLPEWTGENLPKLFADTLDLPVTLENDANLGALGESFWPPALGTKSLVYIRLATGIGGGLVLNGELYRGAEGTAGEIGHHSIDESGLLCRCGNRGCLEAIASVPGFLQVLGSALNQEVNVETWVKLARSGHFTAVRLMEDLGKHLGVAVANIINLLNPHQVIIGGPISAVGDILIAPLRTEVRQRGVPAATRSVIFAKARHGDYSEVYGACHLALNAVLHS